MSGIPVIEQVRTTSHFVLEILKPIQSKHKATFTKCIPFSHHRFRPMLCLKLTVKA